MAAAPKKLTKKEQAIADRVTWIRSYLSTPMSREDIHMHADHLQHKINVHGLASLTEGDLDSIRLLLAAGVKVEW